MLHNEIITLSKIRLEKAKECLEDSRSAKNEIFLFGYWNVISG